MSHCNKNSLHSLIFAAKSLLSSLNFNPTLQVYSANAIGIPIPVIANIGLIYFKIVDAVPATLDPIGPISSVLGFSI